MMSLTSLVVGLLVLIGTANLVASGEGANYGSSSSANYGSSSSTNYGSSSSAGSEGSTGSGASGLADGIIGDILSSVSGSGGTIAGPQAGHGSGEPGGSKSKQGVEALTIYKGTENSVEKTYEKKETEIGFLGASSPGEYLKLLNPVELLTRVAKHFKLDGSKFFELVGKGTVFGLELVLQPLLITLKIVEKIFVPDTCRLRFVCKLATPFAFAKGHLPKLSTKFIEQSVIVKTFSEGVHGTDCDKSFACPAGGELKLKKQFETLGVQSESAEQVYASASSPLTRVLKLNGASASQ